MEENALLTFNVKVQFAEQTIQGNQSWHVKVLEKESIAVSIQTATQLCFVID